MVCTKIYLSFTVGRVSAHYFICTRPNFLTQLNFSKKILGPRKKSSTKSDFKICYGDVNVIQNCKKKE